MSFHQFDSDSLEKLKFVIDLCKSKPEVLYEPEFTFLRSYIESLGGKIPGIRSMPETGAEGNAADNKQAEIPTVESDPESDLELDMEGCIEPDVGDAAQVMGDGSKQPTEEEIEKADEKRREALLAFSEANYEKAVELFTEAIIVNPQSALLFAKRGQTYLKLLKPNACIRDCTRALELNCDSASAYKFRGRAYRLVGEWEKAAKDLRQACNIDYDEQTDEWLKEVTPNAKKIEQHRLKLERRKLEKEERDRMERLRKAKEAHAKAAHQEPTTNTQNQESSNAEGPGFYNNFQQLLQDPDVLAAFQVILIYSAI